MPGHYHSWSTKTADKIEDTGRHVVKKLQKWSKDDPSTWTDDALRIGGKALQGAGKVASLPGIKHGLSVLGAGGWVGGKVGGKVAEKLKIDPRLGRWVGGAAGDLVSVGGVAKKALQISKTAKTINKLNKAGAGLEALHITKNYNRLGKKGYAFASGPKGALKTQADWRDAITVSPKGRELLADKADYIIPDQIQSINKLKGKVAKAEKAKLAELRKTGVIKEAPTHTLTSSADATKYYGLDTKQLKKYGLKYDQRGSTRNPKFELGLTETRAMDTKKRELSMDMLTPNKAVNKAGKDKWNRINKKLGQEAHHIIPIHVSTEVMLDFLYDKTGKIKPGGMAKWKARVAEDAKKGIFHGNDRRNIVAARGSKKVPLTEAGQRSEIYHRQGFPEMDNPGYHTLEKLVTGLGLDEGGVPLYHQLRDLMSDQQKLKNHADKFWYEIIDKPRPGPKHTFKDGKNITKQRDITKQRKKIKISKK